MYNFDFFHISPLNNTTMQILSIDDLLEQELSGIINDGKGGVTFQVEGDNYYIILGVNEIKGDLNNIIGHTILKAKAYFMGGSLEDLRCIEIVTKNGIVTFKKL